jgi:hypothetical protein
MLTCREQADAHTIMWSGEGWAAWPDCQCQHRLSATAGRVRHSAAPGWRVVRLVCAWLVMI